MYKNLEAEIIRKGLRKKDIAKAIGRSYNTLLTKLRGEYPLTYDEAEIIQRKFFPEIDIMVLFERDKLGA